MLINRSSVIRMKIPFPDISSDLAVKSHMYICHRTKDNTYGFVKCQTLKPYMLLSAPMAHYWDEQPDIKRNPFKRTTRIDCDKEFVTCTVDYDDRLKTDTRPDVCADTMKHIDIELAADGYASNRLKEDELLSLNHLIKPIE